LLGMLGTLQSGAVKILFTSYLVQKLAKEASRAGVHAVIRKPFTMEALENALTRSFPRGRPAGRESVGAR